MHDDLFLGVSFFLKFYFNSLVLRWDDLTASLTITASDDRAQPVTSLLAGKSKVSPVFSRNNKVSRVVIGEAVGEFSRSTHLVGNTKLLLDS